MRDVAHGDVRGDARDETVRGAVAELIPPVRQTLWGPPAVANFTLGGIGAGLYICAALAARLEPSPAVTLAAWLGPLLVLAGFGAVALEAGRPLRGPRVIARLQTSWMSRELLVGGAFAVFALAELVRPAALLRLLAVAAALALALAQGFIVRRARGVAAWDVPVVPLVFLASALVSGAGAFALAAAVRGEPAPAGLLAAGAGLVAGALAVWLGYVRWPADVAFARATAPLREGWLARAIVLGGYAAPLGLLALAVAAGGSAPILAAAGVLLLAGQALAKWALVITVAVLRPITLAGLQWPALRRTS